MYGHRNGDGGQKSIFKMLIVKSMRVWNVYVDYAALYGTLHITKQNKG